MCAGGFLARSISLAPPISIFTRWLSARCTVALFLRTSRMMVGIGYVEGQAALAMRLLRRHAGLREVFIRRYGKWVDPPAEATEAA